MRARNSKWPTVFPTRTDDIGTGEGGPIGGGPCWSSVTAREPDVGRWPQVRHPPPGSSDGLPQFEQIADISTNSWDSIRGSFAGQGVSLTGWRDGSKRRSWWPAKTSPPLRCGSPRGGALPRFVQGLS